MSAQDRTRSLSDYLNVKFDFSEVCKRTVEDHVGGSHVIFDNMKFSAAQWISLEQHFKKQFAKGALDVSTAADADAVTPPGQ